ncbi:MAG: hypothetical protein GY904_14470 [Planctomycetaceae bacterium]|nr:hypothetical protein [Planctomycetaceae bacterium]
MLRVSRLCSVLLAATISAPELPAGVITDSSGAGFNIPDDDANGITSSITITQDETVTDVEVTLTGLNHTWAGDVTATISNGTVTSTLFARVGDPGGTSGDSSAFNGDYTFSDDGNDLWAEAADAGFGVTIPNLDYKASGVNNSQVVLATDFENQSSAGTWTLFMSDVASGDTGSLTGWGIQLTTTSGDVTPTGVVPEPGTMTMFTIFAGLGSFGFARRRVRHRAGTPFKMG